MLTATGERNSDHSLEAVILLRTLLEVACKEAIQLCPNHSFREYAIDWLLRLVQ